MVEETCEPGSTVSLVARRHGGGPEPALPLGAVAAQGALTATGAEEEVIPASDYRALQNQVRELHRLLGERTPEAEILKEALEVLAGPKRGCCACSRRRRAPDEERRHRDRGRTVQPRRACEASAAQDGRAAAPAG